MVSAEQDVPCKALFKAPCIKVEAVTTMDAGRLWSVDCPGVLRPACPQDVDLL